jgi:branched-chain amino acid transport system permease protein
MSVLAKTEKTSPTSSIGLRGWVMIAILAFLAVGPYTAYIFGHTFYLDLATRLVCLSIAAVSLNLILGYGGMISFGHAAYIGIGAYCVGIPVYYDFTSGFLHFPLAIVICAVFALITGMLCLRTKGVYFIMITMAFAQMVYFFIVSLDEYGADDGLTIYYRSEFPLIDLEDGVTLYYVCFVSLLAALYIVHRIVHSRFGMAIRGSRSNEQRMRAVGYNTYIYRLTCYVISGIMCGYAGALLGNYTSFISPEMIDWTRSGELMFMVIVGGAGSLFGPVLGALLFLQLEDQLPHLIQLFGGFVEGLGLTTIGAAIKNFSHHWRLVFGLLLIVTVLFARGGIDGMLRALERRRRD